MEDKIIIKRSRSSNWSEQEKALLTQLIKEKINIIENKDVSKNNNQVKKAGWQEIHETFNQINESKRDLAQLMNQWRNIKNNAKKRHYEYRRSFNATGGGPRPPSPPPEDVEIMQMLPKEFEIDKNIHDSDSLNLKKGCVGQKEKIEYDQPGSSRMLPLQPIEREKIEYDQPGSSRMLPLQPIEREKIEIDQPSSRCMLPLQPIEREKIEYDQPSSRCMLPLQPIEREKIEYDQPGSSRMLPLQPIEKVQITRSEVVEGKKRKHIQANKKKVTPDISQQKELFLLAKSAREKQMQFQEAEHLKKMKLMEEEHKVRMKILNVELEYWEKKLKD